MHCNFGKFQHKTYHSNKDKDKNKQEGNNNNYNNNNNSNNNHNNNTRVLRQNTREPPMGWSSGAVNMVTLIGNHTLGNVSFAIDALVE